MGSPSLLSCIIAHCTLLMATHTDDVHISRYDHDTSGDEVDISGDELSGDEVDISRYEQVHNSGDEVDSSEDEINNSGDEMDNSRAKPRPKRPWTWKRVMGKICRSG
jgi:hypothetical protein